MSFNASDLAKMELDQLRDLKQRVEKEISERAEKERAMAERRIMELAIASGVDLKSLGAKMTVYRNPNNPLEVWMGKGRKPAWLQALVANGTKLEDLRG